MVYFDVIIYDEYYKYNLWIINISSKTIPGKIEYKSETKILYFNVNKKKLFKIMLLITYFKFIYRWENKFT